MRAPVPHPQTVDPRAPVHFPFDHAYQLAVVKLLCEDGRFAYAIEPYLKPEHFEAAPLVWAYRYIRQHMERYSNPPAVQVLVYETQRLDPKVQMLYRSVLEQVAATPLRDDAWLRDSVLEFIRRNIFVAAFSEGKDLYNAGKMDAAYDLVARRIDDIDRVRWELVDRGWIFDEFEARNLQRANADALSTDVPTMIPWLDGILRGGLGKGELGLWLAYFKVGKTTMLVNHGVAATRGAHLKVAHYQLEGLRRQIEDKYDAAFNQELYSRVKAGSFTQQRHREIVEQYAYLRRHAMVRAYTDEWDVTVKDLVDDLRELKVHDDFVPDLVIVDYGDLLRGRRSNYSSDVVEKREVFRDLHRLSTHGPGFGVWSAVQAQRPEKGAENTPHLVRSNQTAEAIDKIRVADFAGSINATQEERHAGFMRLYAELYRDNAADQWITVKTDFERQVIHTEAFDGAINRGSSSSQMPFGYKQRAVF